MRTVLALAGLFLSCCGTPVPDAGSGYGALPALSFDPQADSAAVPNVVRIHIPSTTLGAGDAALFQGALSSYYLSRIKSGKLPDTLLARQIPLVSWRANGQLVLSPTLPLGLGDYSIAANSGLLGQFGVSAAPPLLTRIWPPSGSARNLTHVVYCGDGSAPLSFEPLVFQPGDLSLSPSAAADASGLFADRCLHLDSEVRLAPGEIVVPPPQSGDWALDPSAFTGAAADSVASLTCETGELALGPGCAVVADDRITVRTPDAELLWSLSSTHGSFLEVTRAGGSIVWRGFSPSTDERIWGNVVDASGVLLPFDDNISTPSVRGHPVLNEVLANPLGPEPQSEWIEIVNDGVLALELSEFRLQDAEGTQSLPNATLAAGEIALLVREDFAPNASDVPPAANARLIRVAQLSRSGLANGGESLSLIDRDSKVISGLPALPEKAGRSLARRHSWSLDADPSAFLITTPTPGAPND